MDVTGGVHGGVDAVDGDVTPSYAAEEDAAVRDVVVKQYSVERIAVGRDVVEENMVAYEYIQT